MGAAARLTVALSVLSLRTSTSMLMARGANKFCTWDASRLSCMSASQERKKEMPVQVMQEVQQPRQEGQPLQTRSMPEERYPTEVRQTEELQQLQLDLPTDMAALSRRELQALAKAAGLRANQKSVDIIAALQAYNKGELADASDALGAMSRRGLQDLARRRGVPPNQATADLVAALAALPSSEFVENQGEDQGESPDVSHGRAREGSADALESMPKQQVSSAQPDPDAGKDGGKDGDAQPALHPESGALMMVRRDLPPMLTPAPCTAGRWLPLRLTGDDVEMTFLARDTAAGVPFDALDVPPLKISSEKLGAMRLECLPPIDLTDEQVGACVEWTSLVLGTTGIESLDLFPPARPVELPSQDATPASARAESGAILGEVEAAALLFLPSDHDLELLPKLREPAQWAEAAGTAHAIGEAGASGAGGTADWPADSSGEPLVVVSVHISGATFIDLPTLQLTGGANALAQFSPNELEGSTSDNPKSKLQSALHKLCSTSLPEYKSETHGIQSWVASVSFHAGGELRTFHGEVAPRKRDAEQDAALRALSWIDEHGDSMMWSSAEDEEAEGSESSHETDEDAHLPYYERRPREAMNRVASWFGGRVSYAVEERGHQVFEATLTLVGVDAAMLRTSAPASAEGVPLEIVGELARSKKNACRNAAHAAIERWVVGEEFLEAIFIRNATANAENVLAERAGGSVVAAAAGEMDRGSDAAVGGKGGGSPVAAGPKMVVPLRATQWRGAACSVVVARMLAHAFEVERLQADLASLLPSRAVPSFAELCAAATPNGIGGYERSNERVKWIGNAVLGLCCKVAAVVALGPTIDSNQQLVHGFFHPAYYKWVSSNWLAKSLRTRGWERALLLRPWPGDEGITRGEASPDMQKDMLEAVVGTVLLRSAAANGIDRAMEDAWTLSTTVVFRTGKDGLPPGEGAYFDRSMSWSEALARLRRSLASSRELQNGGVDAWVARLGLAPQQPSQAALIAAAVLRGYQGQALEFIGDGVLRVLHTLYIMRMLPDAERSKQSRARMAIERNPFLARRLARAIGVDGSGLTRKLREAQIEVLPSIARSSSRGQVDDGGLRDDLMAEEAPKMLADLLEALIGAVALQGAGLEGVQRPFARIAFPPPDVIAELASGDFKVPGRQ